MPELPLPIIVLISGSGTNLQAIIDAIAEQKLNAQICAVISNRPGVKGLERAMAACIPARILDHKDYDDRHSFDEALMELIDSYQPKLVVLAGFMRILTEDFVNHYQGRMLNIHPSLLPDFTGLNTHQRALDASRKEHGVSVHFVTNELDSGPLVIQAVVPISANDTAQTLADKVHTQEHIIYPMAINWFSQGRLTYNNNRVYLDQQPITTVPRWIDNRLET